MASHEKTLNAITSGDFEAAAEEYKRECCDYLAVSCPYSTENSAECAYDCLMGYLNYLSLSSWDEELNKIVSSYMTWYQTNHLMDETAQEKAETGSPSLPENREKVILVVDDDLRILNTTSKILTRQGYEVLQAENGSSAGEILAQKSDTINMVFSDVVMPRGMNGVELAEWV